MLYDWYDKLFLQNTQSSEVEIQHIKHRDIATTKEMEARDDDIDGDENIYETMNDEMSTCCIWYPKILTRVRVQG